ncbi:hypothetical protein HZS_5927 [Henneguya salminicola]|nr:hypothetical protein HZS_5927 [Henneguya salminicola]
MKCQYKKRLVEGILFFYNNKIDFDFNLLDALNLIKLSWDAVSKKTVANCYRRCFASDTINKDTEVSEDHQNVEIHMID